MIALYVPLWYLAAITGAELLTIFVDPLWGIICHIFLLVLLIVNSTAARVHPMRRFFLALGLVPLVRIVSLCMPLSELSLVYRCLIMAVPIALTVFALVMVLKIRLSEIGLSVRGIPIQILVAVCGIGIGLVDYLILRPEQLMQASTWHNAVISALIMLVAVGLVEELVFRGILQRVAGPLGVWGWIYVAVMSSVLQLGHQSVLHWLLALGMGLLYGWTVKKTGSILGVSLSHGIANICLYLVFPSVF